MRHRSRYRPPVPVSNLQDRRRYPRYDVRGLSGTLDGFRVFEALRLSLGGMLVRLPAELALEQRVRVEMTLGGEAFRALARVVFVGPDLEASPLRRDHFRVGLEFLPPSPGGRDYRGALARFIETQLAASEPV